jgi:hypothetical protein
MQRPAQNQQARLRYLDVLEPRLEDEVQRRARHGQARRLAAGFEALKTLEECVFAADPGLPA